MEDPGAAQVDNATVDSALRKAINEQNVDAVRRLLATPGYRFPATRSAVFCLVAAQRVTVGHGRSAHADPPSVQLYRRRGRDMLLALVAACDEDALCRRTLHRNFLDLDRDEAVTKLKGELIFPGMTALHHFAWNGDVEAVQTILDLPQCMSLTHRLFLLRDDALFLKCLEYCWFLDPLKRVPSETDYRRAFGTAATEPES